MKLDGMGWYCGDHFMVVTLWLSGHGIWVCCGPQVLCFVAPSLLWHRLHP